ncbi:hypothetical protein MSG28_003010 [Choristoneura fumiferana]|uniref:Uncharacterized protein n=1 Tax=Choristoneura fumiferana TaxID=7141 RepID=A0ACC0JK75_CHOFU|nr:hypothetical protein MSG28_003010 [Choristoneura fumiferana]
MSDTPYRKHKLRHGCTEKPEKESSAGNRTQVLSIPCCVPYPYTTTEQEYAAECHFVHYNSKYESMEAAVGHADGLAVVGFLLEADDAPNPTFDKLVEGLDGIQKRDQTVQVTAESLSWMDRDDLHEGSYVTYKGSLTTPPYTECVTWIIYEKPVQIGTEQLGLLRQLEGLDSKPIDRNVRPTQRHPPGHSVIYVKQVKAKL